jgi:hypothetical protein
MSHPRPEGRRWNKSPSKQGEQKELHSSNHMFHSITNRL